MSLKEDIKPYLTVDGWVSNAVTAPGTIRNSDNHTCFTSEYYIQLQKNNEITADDKIKWSELIESSMMEPGLTVRFPKDKADDAPDNIIAILSANYLLGGSDVASQILNYGLKHWGWFNPENPGTTKTADNQRTNWQAFQWRQMQLIAASAASAGRLSLLYLPFVIYSALVILWASRPGIALSDYDARRLNWHLVQIMSKKSLLCRLASKIWFRSVNKDYHNGMKDVVSGYFGPSHPLAKYWLD